MTTAAQIALAHRLLATGLLKEVYHFVSLLEDNEGVKYPVFPMGAEAGYVGPNDKADRYAYIRTTGPVQKGEERMEGSELRMYHLSAPTRIVVFKDHETANHDSLIRKLLAPCFEGDVSLVSYQHDAFKLGRQESPVGDFRFDGTTFYLAIDIQLRWWATAADCEDDACIEYPNPICK